MLLDAAHLFHQLFSAEFSKRQSSSEEKIPEVPIYICTVKQSFNIFLGIWHHSGIYSETADIYEN